MREILFRGKWKDNGEWVYGYYSPANIPIMGCVGHFINEGGYRAVEVDPETVCQYTGLTDKNGKKIFDGDILESHYDDNHPNDSIIETIVWQGNGWCIKQGSLDPDPIQATNILSYSKVVGSIHDNPELLEDE